MQLCPKKQDETMTKDVIFDVKCQSEVTGEKEKSATEKNCI